MDKPWSPLREYDAEVYNLIEKEFTRQQQGLELIASENFASEQTITSAANVFTNKYAEGKPHKRYYGGCHVVDELEDLAIERAKALFGCKFANVQPHSGAQANASVFLGVLNPGDSILGLDLSHGGHLTHGSKVNFSGVQYNSHFYQLDSQTQLLDYDQIEKQALNLRPKMIIAGASAYPRQIDFKKFREICDRVNALLFVDMAHIAGLVAAGAHPSPLKYADIVTTTTHKTLRGPRGGLILWNDENLSNKINKGVFPGTQGGPLEHIIASKAICFKEAFTPQFKEYQNQVVSNAKALASSLLTKDFKLVSGGTDNHLVLLNLLDCSYSGKDLEEALEKVCVTVNKNTVPQEKRSPFVTSGIRLGTPAVTSRGMKEDHLRKIGEIIFQVAQNISNPSALAEIKQDVLKLAESFPLYPGWINKK